jgi:hypothetical protein
MGSMPQRAQVAGACAESNPPRRLQEEVARLKSAPNLGSIRPGSPTMSAGVGHCSPNTRSANVELTRFDGHG